MIGVKKTAVDRAIFGKLGEGKFLNKYPSLTLEFRTSPTSVRAILLYSIMSHGNPDCWIGLQISK